MIHPTPSLHRLVHTQSQIMGQESLLWDFYLLCCTVNGSGIYSDTILTLVYVKFLEFSFTINEEINIERFVFER
jgi:hypothetical protein